MNQGSGFTRRTFGPPRLSDQRVAYGVQGRKRPARGRSFRPWTSFARLGREDPRGLQRPRRPARPVFYGPGQTQGTGFRVQGKLRVRGSGCRANSGYGVQGRTTSGSTVSGLAMLSHKLYKTKRFNIRHYHNHGAGGLSMVLQVDAAQAVLVLQCLYKEAACVI